MAISGTYTNRNLVHAALRKVGVIGQHEAATGEQYVEALEALWRMLKSWQNQGHNLWLVDYATVPLTTSSTYALDPAPFDVQSVRFKSGGIETPMRRMTRGEYDSIPQKSSSGIPTGYYFDKRKEGATLLVWPSLAVVSGQELSLTVVREIEDTESEAEADVPAEWYDAVIYGLAARLADDYQIDPMTYVFRAEREFRDASANDQEDSVYFMSEDYGS